VYYGDTSSSFQSGTGGTSVNMADTSTTAARVETPELGPGVYVTWNDLVTGTGGVNASDPSATVSAINLVVDGGWGGSQVLNLTDAKVGINGVVSTFTMPSSTPVQTTSPAAYIDVTQISGSTQGTVDETTYTGVGDTGGQFSVVDSMYKYNLATSSLPGVGTYNVSIKVGGTDYGTVQFTLK
jgi:hypothetical protein